MRWAPQEAGHEGGVNFFLDRPSRVRLAISSRMGPLPAAEESGEFVMEALAFRRLVGEAHQAVHAGPGQQDDEGVLLGNFGADIGDGLLTFHEDHTQVVQEGINWKENIIHRQAQSRAKDWYRTFRVRVCRVEREYGF